MAKNSRRPQPSAAYRKLEWLDASDQKLLRYAKKINQEKGYAAITVTLSSDRIFVSCDNLIVASEIWRNHKALRPRLMITYGGINYTPARLPSSLNG